MQNFVKDWMEKQSDWRFPMLFLSPSHPDYTEYCLKSNLVYVCTNNFSRENIVDHVKKILRKPNLSAPSMFRQKPLSHEGKIDNDTIPQNQIGLAVAVNFFNYRPLEVMREYLTEMHNILRPSGVFIFTYNNCDLPGSVRNVEKTMYSYTPGGLVQAMVQGLGFEILNVVDYEDVNVSWLEIKKPGELKTMRGGQDLAKIIKHPTDVI